jgi:TP901 family phage tail tape measure protein
LARSLQVTIVGDASSFRAALGSAAGATEGFGRKMQSLGASTAAIGKSMTRNLTLPIVGAGIAAGKMALDFEDSMQQLRTSAGASQKEVDKMSKAVLNMAQTSKAGGQGPEALAKALYMVESSGIRGGAALKVLSAAAINARVTGADMTEVVGALTSAVKVQAKGTGDAAHAMGVLNAVVGAGKMRMADLTSSLRSGILPVAKQLGVSLPELGAALDVFTIAGVPAEDAATKLRTAFLKMLAPTGAGAKALKSMGISSTDLAVTLSKGGLTGALTLLSGHLEAYRKKLEETHSPVQAAAMANAALINSFGGSKTGATILTLVQQFDQYNKSLGQVDKTTKDYATSAAKVMDLPASKIKEAIASIQSSLVQIGVTLAPTFAKIAGYVANLVQKFDTLSPAARRWVLIGAGLAAALGPVVGIVGNLARVIGGLASAGAFLVANPWVAGLTALALAVAAVTGKLDALPFSFLKSGADQVRDAFNGLADAVRNAKSALDNLVQSDLSAESAHLRVTETMHAEQAAMEALTKVRADAKSSTLAISQAEDAYNRSVLDHKQALADVTAAQKGQTQATKDLTGSYTEHVGKLQELVAKNQASVDTWVKATGSTKEMAFMQDRVNKVLASTSTTLTTGANAMAAYAVKIATIDPKAASAALKIRDLDLATRTFITSHSRLPTKTELQILIKKVETQNFAKQLKDVQIAAFTAARVATQDFQSGIKPLPAHAGMAASQATAGVRTKLAPMAGIGAAAGAGLAGGVARGITAQTGAAVAAAAALVAAVKVTLGKWGSDAFQWANTAVGKRLIEGLAAGIIASEGLATGAAEKAKQAIKARLEATDLLAAAKVAGQTIGSEHAMAILRGILQGQPTILAQYKQAVAQWTATARQAIVDAKSAFASAFSQLAQDALSAFDEKMAAWTPPSLILLNRMQLQDQIDSAKKAVTDAQTAMNAAIADLNAKQAAVDTLAPTEGETPEAFAARRAQAEADLAAANTAALAAQAAFGAAKRAQVELNLQLEAAQEQRAHDERVARQREHLAQQLAELQANLAKHPQAWRKVQDDILKILKAYDVPMYKAGQRLASQFADGLTKGIAAVAKAARELAAALDKIANSSGGGGGGDGNTAGRALGGAVTRGLPYIVGERGPELFVPSLSGRIIPNSTSTMGAVSGSRRDGGGGSYSGPETIQIVLNGQVIGEVVYRELLRRQGRNVAVFG